MILIDHHPHHHDQYHHQHWSCLPNVATDYDSWSWHTMIADHGNWWLYFADVTSVTTPGFSLKFPGFGQLKVLHQVTVGEEVPAVITPLKPKYHLLGSVVVKSGHAVKLKWTLDSKTGSADGLCDRRRGIGPHLGLAIVTYPKKKPLFVSHQHIIKI